MKKKQSENVSCPVCGTELTIRGGKATVTEAPPAKLPGTAKERIEALRAMGMDVSHLFAMQGANGGECIASNKDGHLTMLDDDDPIFRMITGQGDVPNRRLFRRWVMAQMFHMMTCTDYRSGKPTGVTEMIHRLGYEYQWRMLLDELHAQMKMEERDPENFADRNRWFNTGVVYAMAEDYVCRLKVRINSQKVKKCKGVPYKRVGSRNVFVEDMETKIYRPLQTALYEPRIPYSCTVPRGNSTGHASRCHTIRPSARRGSMPTRVPERSIPHRISSVSTAARPSTTRDDVWTSTSRWRSSRQRPKPTRTARVGVCWPC